MIKSIAECGANVIITSSKFSEMAMHYCERYNIMMLKVSLLGRVVAGADRLRADRETARADRLQI